jgi:DNA topoisomerase-6 subunit B
LGISAAILYAQKTTGFPTEIVTKVEGELTAFHFVLDIDIRKNAPHTISVTPEIWEAKHGLKIAITLKGKYVSGKQSVEEYIRETAIANPHSSFHLILPDKTVKIERSINKAPEIPVSVKPHPHGVELGELISIFRENEEKSIESVMEERFSRVTKQTAKSLVEKSKLKNKKIPQMTRDDFENLMNAIKETEFIEPRKDCLSPIGAEGLFKSAMNSFKDYHPAYFSQPVIRGPFVFSGHPFLAEAIAIYGGDLPKEDPIKVLRFANNQIEEPTGADIISVWQLRNNQGNLLHCVESVWIFTARKGSNPCWTAHHRSSPCKHQDSLHFRGKRGNSNRSRDNGFP